jgi:hypothetical protein
VILRFVAEHLRWLARIPLAVHLFDALLLSWTALFHRDQLRAMENLEIEVLRLSGVKRCVHRLGGIGFVHGRFEFAHLHGNGLLDVHLTVFSAAALISSGRAFPHHVLGNSAWISLWIRSTADVENAMSVLTRVAER